MQQPNNFQLLLEFFSLLETFSSYSTNSSFLNSSNFHHEKIYSIMKNITIIFDHLKFQMNHTMAMNYDFNSSSLHNSSNASSPIRTRVRSFGLILSALYLPQLFDWIISDIFQKTSSRLLIIQSEYMFKNRFKFFQNDLLHFLHPTTMIQLPMPWLKSYNLSIDNNNNLENDSHLINFNVTSFLSLAQEFKNNILHNSSNKIATKIKPISNQKIIKLSESKISKKMKETLINFLNGHLFLCSSSPSPQRRECERQINYTTIFHVIEKIQAGKYIFKPSLHHSDYNDDKNKNENQWNAWF